MTVGLQRSVLLLLCAASALLAGCVSQGKYDDLEGKYTTLQRQYTELQGQYTQLQQTSAAQAARCNGLVKTQTNEYRRSLSPICRARSSPDWFRGMSVRPVRWRESVQAVSPCRVMYNFGISNGMATSAGLSLLDVVPFGRGGARPGR